MKFEEENSDFYDTQYYMAHEARFVSGTYASKIGNIMELVGRVDGLRCLDVGSGGGFFANQFAIRGASVVGIDYSRFAVQFAKDRFPTLDFRIGSGYDLSQFKENEFDVVTLLDVIEHLSDQKKMLGEIKRVLRPGGKLVISTDVEDSLWSRGVTQSLIHKTHFLSASGRAYKFIKWMESKRYRTVDYHAAHIGLVTFEYLEDLLQKSGFTVTAHRIYPLIGVPVRDFFLRFLPKKYRGDHQCIVAVNTK